MARKWQNQKELAAKKFTTCYYGSCYVYDHRSKTKECRRKVRGNLIICPFGQYTVGVLVGADCCCYVGIYCIRRLVVKKPFSTHFLLYHTKCKTVS